MASMILTIDNNGAAITSTNFWSTEYAGRGAVYVTQNAGAFRLLLPPALEEILADLASAKLVIVSRGPWPAQHRDDAIELLVDDGTDSPYALHIGTEQIDRLPLDTDADREWHCTVWIRGADDAPTPVIDRPARYRRVRNIPDLSPWKGRRRMDIRIKGLSGALIRRFARKAGTREQERIIVARLIEPYVDGAIDPLSQA